MTVDEIADFVQQRISFGHLAHRCFRNKLSVRFWRGDATFVFVLRAPERESGNEVPITSERTVPLSMFGDWDASHLESWLFEELIAPAWTHELVEHYKIDGLRIRDPHEQVTWWPK